MKKEFLDTRLCNKQPKTTLMKKYKCINLYIQKSLRKPKESDQEILTRKEYSLFNRKTSESFPLVH